MKRFKFLPPRSTADPQLRISRLPIGTCDELIGRPCRGTRKISRSKSLKTRGTAYLRKLCHDSWSHHETHFKQKLEYERAPQMQAGRTQLDSGRARPLSRELVTLPKPKARIWPRVQEQMFKILQRVAVLLDRDTCYFTEKSSGCKAGSYSWLIDVCATQL